MNVLFTVILKNDKALKVFENKSIELKINQSKEIVVKKYLPCQDQ